MKRKMMDSFLLPARRNSVLLTLFFVACSGLCPLASRGEDQPTTAKVQKGQRVMICGHSFHYFLAPLLDRAVAAAGIIDHKDAGTQALGGSTVTEHWNLPDAQNKVKAALIAGNLDVLTLSPHMRLIPDKAIEDFAALGFAHNPNVRVLAQESWVVFDNWNKQLKDNADRNAETIEQVRGPLEEFKTGLEKQAREINAKLGKQVVFVVPVGDAVLALRAKVIAGEVPGIARQSDLFVDNAGHPGDAVQHLEAYCYLAAIYHRNPVGLTVFDQPADSNSHKLNLLLEQIAWDTVTSDPMSGVSKTDDK